MNSNNNTTEHDSVAFAQTLGAQAMQRWDVARERGQKTAPFARLALRAVAFLVRAAAQQSQWRDPARALLAQIMAHAQAEDDACIKQGINDHVWLGMLLTCATFTERLDSMARRDAKHAEREEALRQRLAEIDPQLAASLAPRETQAARLAPAKAPGIPSDIAQLARNKTQQRMKWKKRH